MQRIGLFDSTEITDLKDFERIIGEWNSEGLVVFADALYNIDIGSGRMDTREANIERANRLKNIVSKFRIPLIASGEARKRSTSRDSKDVALSISDIMETGKYGYNADLVWAIYPDFEREKSIDQWDVEETPRLILKYAKNKLSSFRGTQKLVFTRGYGKITEFKPLKAAYQKQK
jgi:hypothetical protein